jgi:SAM-dependent methyltransferase
MDKQTQKQLLGMVKGHYAEIAEAFNETRKKYPSPLWNGLQSITKEIQNESKVLDVGCGNGRLLVFLKDKKIKYLGVDTCQELLAEARKLNPEENFASSDILGLSQLSEINFQYVFCIAVMHHLPGLDLRVQALKQLKNKISNDGKIIITVWNFWQQKKYLKLIARFFILKILGKSKMDFGDILFDWKRDLVSRRYYHAFTKSEFRKISKLAGLKIEKLYKDRFNYYLILRR